MHERASVVSVNVGGVRRLDHLGREITTGIFKQPVDGPVAVAGVNLAGDDQADRKVHGGPDKAIYAFPHEHYAGWRDAFPNADWDTHGALGENLTVTGLLEEDVSIGDRFRCGTTELVVRQPRLPCFKFAIRIGDPAAVRHMIETRQTGFYFGIAAEGSLQAGDRLEYLGGPDQRLSVRAFVELYVDKERDPAAMRRAYEHPELPESWRDWFAKRLE